MPTVYSPSAFCTFGVMYVRLLVHSINYIPGSTQYRNVTGMNTAVALTNLHCFDSLVFNVTRVFKHLTKHCFFRSHSEKICLLLNNKGPRFEFGVEFLLFFWVRCWFFLFCFWYNHNIIFWQKPKTTSNTALFD